MHQNFKIMQPALICNIQDDDISLLEKPHSMNIKNLFVQIAAFNVIRDCVRDLLSYSYDTSRLHIFIVNIEQLKAT
jgi:hypothetical protein